jgi:hypothetical protein
VKYRFTTDMAPLQSWRLIAIVPARVFW